VNSETASETELTMSRPRFRGRTTAVGDTGAARAVLMGVVAVRR